MSDLLDVAAVMRRYGLRDRRSARRIMATVGDFKLATNLYVREADLLAYEQELIATRRAPGQPPPIRRPAVVEPRRGRNVREPLPRDWWREGTDADTLATGAGKEG